MLQFVKAHPDEPETPYWRSATRAEALLLLDRDEEAQAAFAEAVALAPEAWEDHASTLRQFGLILAEQGKDASWLDAHRPPRSVHFGGHMSFDPAIVRRDGLDEAIGAVLDEEKVGFGFGALAAGADIIVAEALLERGAEVHAVLPGGAEAFAAASVDPFGDGWRERFDAILARAATVRAVRPIGTRPDLAMVELGDEIALGAAAMNARRLESAALQLLVVPEREEASPGSPPGVRRRIVAAPREQGSAPPPAPLPSAPHSRLALLTVALGAEEGAADRLAGLAAALAAAPPPSLPAWFTGRETLVGYPSPAEAAAAGSALAAAGFGVGGHYGIAGPIEDPFGGGARVGGEAAALASAAAASAPTGTICVTADFAAALAAAPEPPARSELVGELEPSSPGAGPVELYALKP